MLITDQERKKFERYQKLRTTSGMGFDPNTGGLVCSDAMWHGLTAVGANNNNINQSNVNSQNDKKSQGYRLKGIANYEMWVALCSNRATGRFAQTGHMAAAGREHSSCVSLLQHTDLLQCN